MTTATLKLASGYDIPQVGFGIWKVPRETCAEQVYNAIKSGYRLIDGAYDYQNEIEAGAGVRRAIEEGIVTREEIFITTKLWNNYHEKKRALEMAKLQNEKWGLGYIDLYLMHFPTALKYIEPSKLEFPAWWMDADRTTVESARVPIRETWEALEEVVDLGIARSIGVSNFSAQSLYDIQTYNKYPISSLQIEHHPYLVQPELIQLCKEQNIIVTAYSSYGPQSFLELPGVFSELATEITPLLKHEAITAIADKYGKSPAQVLLRWSTQREICVIPKSNNQGRLAENLNHTDFDMTEEELKSISGLNKGLRFNDPGYYLPNHPLRIFA
ncbi:putative NAD(P)H-dependent D-xylose reductase xyl1 [Cyberlindnera fabianii]|uniref:Putative NAD(P)H-dependent D-xylose reductase xyl1 n=1 Tax=Cyberlindnera fabianii TaxID=36022 RepID=A0A1V2KZ33_CYBFA|nr:putative NAD(P)H-dependent D-xylose reductase xyl1 [Cyberlindnera fabianii]